MAKKARGVKGKSKQVEQLDPNIMLHATNKANSRKAVADGLWGANLGDSIERRFNGGGGGYGGFDGLGGADGGIWNGNQGSYNAVGYGNYGGAGLAYGPYGRGSPYGGGMYGSGGFRYLKRFSGSAGFIHQIIASCVLCYLSEGIVRRVLDLYADLACEQFTIVHPDKSVRNFYETWAKKTKITERLRTFFLTMFTTGNVFIYRHWASLSPADKLALKKMSAKVVGENIYVEDEDEDRKIEASVENSWFDNFIEVRKSIPIQKTDSNKKTSAAGPAPTVKGPLSESIPVKDGMIPWGYTALNPLQMELRGKKFQGENYWIMALDKSDTKEILAQYGYNSTSQDLGSTRVNLPKELKGKIGKYNGGGVGYVSEIKFDATTLTPLQDYKFDWFDWAIPFVFPVLAPLGFKGCLRKMEIRACESVINSIFLFKLGDLKNGMPAEEEHFERLADMLQMPGQVQNIIWNEAISAEVIQPDVTKIFDSKKYESADKDIMMALGIPESMLGGKSSSFQHSFITLVTVMERLESTRNLLESWLMGELEAIAKVMGFRRLPTIKWARSALKDEAAVRTLFTNLYDRGILSRDTLLREFDTDFDTELSKQLEEDGSLPAKKPDIMDPKGPFIRTPPAGAIPPGGGPPKPGAAGPKTANGRPPASKEVMPRGPQKNKRKPQGQSLAYLFEYDELLEAGKEMFESLEDRIANKMIKARGLKYVKELEQADKERLEGLICNVFSHMPSSKPATFDTEDFLLNTLQSNTTARIKANVLALYAEKIARYEAKFGKQPSKDHRRQFLISAWTQTSIAEKASDVIITD
jgi:hypothetical protein